MSHAEPSPTARPAGNERRQFVLGAIALLAALTVRAPVELLPFAAAFDLALAVAVAFAVAAWLLHGVNISGALAGTAVAFALYRALGPRGFALLFAVFVLTWISTRIGRSRKLQLAVRDDTRGRNASQVLANVGIAALLTLLVTGSMALLWITAVVAALAEAAADTVSSEIGEASGATAILLTTGERVPPGTDGGITVAGSVAGLVAAIVIAAAAFFLGLLPLRLAALAAIAGVLGAVFDSALGALFERRGYLGNNLVNLLSTAFAAGMAVLAAQYLPVS